MLRACIVVVAGGLLLLPACTTQPVVGAAETEYGSGPDDDDSTPADDDGSPDDDDGGPGGGTGGPSSGSGPDTGGPTGDPGDCDGLTSCSGVCVDLGSDHDHCGACGAGCDDYAVCEAGTCVGLPDECPPEGCPDGSYCDLAEDRCVAGCLHDVECTQFQSCEDRDCTQCQAGFGNCDVPAEDGCETDLRNDDANCGACGNACSSERRCVQSECECGGGLTECGGVCIDTDSSEAHCGGCNDACPDVANGFTSCEAGDCEVTCDAGYHECGGSCVSDTSTDGCGDSCSPCPGVANAEPTCDGTSCGFDCDAGYVPCDDGCCEHCDTAGCAGFTYCEDSTGLCEDGCTLHEQCAGSEFCYLADHECVRTVDTSCPAGYSYLGYCPGFGTSFCVHAGTPAGTDNVFEDDCPAGSTARGSFTCGGTTYVCIPDD